MFAVTLFKLCCGSKTAFRLEHLNLINMYVILVTEEKYKEEEKLSLEQFSTANPISGIQKPHTFVPVRNSVH
jgi:hypothetical protein